jgi:putative resolvase
MKSSEVRRLLGVTERTLTNYNNRGILHPVKINEKHYEYDEKEVYSLVNKNIDSRKNVTYARVSLRKQKDDLLRQNERLYDFCNSKGIELAEQLEDIKSGMNFNERKSFIRLVTMVVNHEIDTVVIENKDRLVRFGFDLVEELFKQHGTKIIVMSDVENKSYERELTDDLISIIHYYSMKSYSNRRRLHNAQKALEENEQNEVE